MGSLRLVPLAQGLSDFEAKVLTAQLGAEGIIWQVRGVVDSVYPLGDIDVLVPVDELDAARPLLTTTLLTADDELDGADGLDTALATYRTSWWFAAMLLALAITFFFLRLLAMG